MNRKTIAVFAVLLAVLVSTSQSCRRHVQVLRDPADAWKSYELPETHPDNVDLLKARFFQEPFRDLNGDMVQIDDLIGTPLVIVMFASFLTEDGKKSLLGLEAMQSDRYGQFRTIFIPFEGPELIRPSIIQAPEGMLFLFRADGSNNASLMDKYSDLFWDHEIISADFPIDPPELHHIMPFYWVVDGSGDIREKLIDYSNTRGIEITELAEVLNALIGPPPAPEERVEEYPLSISNGGSDIEPEYVEEIQD